jgi:hypothetical protein
MSLATMALSLALEQPGAATQEVAALQVAAGGDPVVARAVALLPREIHAKAGVPTRYALQGRFPAVARAGRVAALTPENGGVFGMALGQATAALVLPATKAAGEARAAAADIKEKALSALKGPIAAVSGVFASAQGLFGGAATPAAAAPAPAPAAAAAPAAPSSAPATEAAAALEAAANAGRRVVARANEVTDEASRVGDLFDRAEASVGAGDLAGAVALLSSLQGGHAGTAGAIDDWVNDARARLEADAALRLLQARNTVLAASLY